MSCLSVPFELSVRLEVAKLNPGIAFMVNQVEDVDVNPV
jgi:hypothetical protein